MLHLDPVPQVWGITGNLGGGKSLTAVTLAAVAMSHGFFVVSNITLDLDELASEYGNFVRRLYLHFSFDDEDFDPFALPTGSPRGTPGGKRVLVIMDECAEWIDQYSSVNTNPRIKRFMSWLRHSSKRSQDVILVVQRLDYLNKSIRLLISKWVIVDDLKVWRVPIAKLPIPFMGGFVMQRVFDRNKRLIQGPCIVRKKSFGRFYRTSECLNSDGAGINYEYSATIRNDFPFLSYVAFYALSLYVLLLMLGRWNNMVESSESRLLPELRHTPLLNQSMLERRTGHTHASEKGDTVEAPLANAAEPWARLRPRLTAFVSGSDVERSRLRNRCPGSLNLSCLYNA